MDIRDEGMKSLVIEAMFKSLDEKKRDELLKAALDHLLTSKTGVYGSPGLTPLQETWNMAIREVARDITAEVVKKDPRIRDMIQDLLRKAMAKVMEQEDQVATRIAEGIVSAMHCHYER